MQVSRTAKLVATASLIVAAFLYLVLVDLGVNAGRVHYGVHVDGYELGGRTFTEAVALLARHGDDLRDEPIIYRVGTHECAITPGDIGWGPQPHDTAEVAMGVGRPSLSIDSIRERIDAWLGGVRVGWADDANRDKVDAVIEECHEKAGAADRPIDEAQVQALLGRFLFDV